MTGLAPEERELARASRELARLRSGLVRRRLPTRTVAFTSPDRGADLVRLASEEEVDLLLVDGRRPLLGEGIPRGEVGALLERAPCDVAVLVERERVPELDEYHPIVVPFSGDDHDWAALELAAWVASANDTPLRLLGAGGGDGRDASRLLAAASLVVQQLAGVSAEPLLVPPGGTAVLEAAAGAGLLVVGLSARWREEGLGPVRAAIARSASGPTLFVRRGSRGGALAARTGTTRFAWSRA